MSDQTPASYTRIPAPTELAIYHSGPDFSEGPLPTVFYFALSGEESLSLDPYNQPIAFLKGNNIRTISFTLPSHGTGAPNTEMMGLWAEEVSRDNNVIAQFVQDAIRNIDYLISEDYVDAARIGVAGLSRGGFAAAHLAAQDPRIKAVLGYAPLTQLDQLDAFQPFLPSALAEQLSLMNLADQLADRRVRFYIGNHDTCVGTEACFKFIQHLANTAYQKRVRPSYAELIISPSIGHKGHGTSPQTFEDGMRWLIEQL